MDIKILKKTLLTIGAYFNSLPKRNTKRFIIEVSVLSFGLKIIAVAILAAIILIPGIESLITPWSDDDLFYDVESASVIFPLFFIAIIVFIGPLVETFVAQLLPIEFLNTITNKPLLGIAASTIFFALLHGFPGMLIILPGGFIFAWSYHVQRQHSLRHAFLVTSILHMIQNSIALPLVYLDIFLTKDINGFWISLL